MSTTHGTNAKQGERATPGHQGLPHLPLPHNAYAVAYLRVKLVKGNLVEQTLHALALVVLAILTHFTSLHQQSGILSTAKLE